MLTWKLVVRVTISCSSVCRHFCTSGIFLCSLSAAGERGGREEGGERREEREEGGEERRERKREEGEEERGGRGRERRGEEGGGSKHSDARIFTSINNRGD